MGLIIITLQILCIIEVDFNVLINLDDVCIKKTQDVQDLGKIFFSFLFINALEYNCIFEKNCLSK